MLLILEVWLALAVTVCVLGVAVERFLTRGVGADGEALDGGIVALLGLGALTTLAGLLSLVLPMNGVGVSAVAAFVAGVGWRSRADLRRRFASMLAALASRSRLDLLVGLSVIAAALVWACVPTPLYDDGAYHAQAIRWAEEYPAVPGLANLQYRLAWVPTWFVASAATSGSFAGERVVALNSFCFLCVALYLWNGLPGLRRSPTRIGPWLRVLGLPGALLVANESLSHATPDLPVAVLWFALLGLAVQEIEQPERPEAEVAALALGALALFSVSLRLSALPALLFAGWIAHRRRRAAWLFGIGTLVAAPGLLRNTVQSGFPFLPLSWPRFAELDWTLPAETLDQARLDIATSARGGLALLWPDRLAIPLVVLASLLVWLPAAGPRFAPLRRFRSVLTGGFLALLFWIGTAPDPRFARGYYLPLALLVAICVGLGPALALGSTATAAQRRRPLLAQCLVSLLLLFELTRAARLLPSAAVWRRAAAPPSFASSATLLGGLAIHRTAVEAGCWYEPFPCVDQIPPIEPRGASLRQGFRPSN